MQTLRTNQQNTQFHTLLALRKFDAEDKAELVSAVSEGRTRSSKELTKREMDVAIGLLSSEQEASVKRMRAKIINICRDIFGLRPGDQWTQLHFDSLNVFLKDKYKLPLHKLSYLQLIKAVTSMEAWRDSTTKAMLKTLI